MPTILEGRPEVTTSVIEVSGVAQQIGNRSPVSSELAAALDRGRALSTLSRRRLMAHERPVTDLLRTPENDPCARRSHGSMRYKRGYPHLKGLGSAA